MKAVDEDNVNLGLENRAQPIRQTLKGCTSSPLPLLDSNNFGIEQNILLASSWNF